MWHELPPIGGFPAVAFQKYKDQVSCTAAVGLSDELTVDVPVSPSRAKYGEVDPCDAAQDMAEMLVENLKERAGR
ncbi:hypothetical protein MINT15_11800 [Saccharomonospora viridis]|uniref:Uncharacterized protein n=1 Tax=Saccharomonospora viridis TaxID=1852 RepID=A0A837DBL2_9PSEU|nr:hypothetical protein MINT15_11800 [Saccharomonospora viridis]